MPLDQAGPHITRTDRIAIKNAVLALCAGATFAVPINGYTTWASPPSRRLKLWNAVDVSQQPALFLTQHREGYDNRGVGAIVRRWLILQLWCYAPTGDANSGIIGDDLLDVMEAALEVALDTPVGYDLHSLGGLAYSMKIERAENLAIRDPGDIDGQALLVLPVRVLWP